MAGTSTTFRPTDDGLYTLVVTVTDDDGSWAIASAQLTVVNRPPIALLDPTTAELEGAVVTVPTALAMAVEVRDPDGTVVSVEWLGEDDEVVATGPVVTMDISDEGAVSLYIVVTDNDGATADLWLNLTANVPPVAVFNISREGAGIVGVDIHPEVMLSFDGSLSSDPGPIARYQWEFGDGLVQEGRTVQHAYAAEGAYKVTLKITDDHGATTEYSMDVLIVKRPREEVGLTASSLAIIGIVLVVVVIAGVATLMYMRQRGEG